MWIANLCLATILHKLTAINFIINQFIPDFLMAEFAIKSYKCEIAKLWKSKIVYISKK